MSTTINLTKGIKTLFPMHKALPWLYILSSPGHSQVAPCVFTFWTFKSKNTFLLNFYKYQRFMLLIKICMGAWNITKWVGKFTKWFVLYEITENETWFSFIWKCLCMTARSKCKGNSWDYGCWELIEMRMKKKKPRSKTIQKKFT